MVINWEADSVFLCDEQAEAAGFVRQQKTSLVFVKAATTCIASYPAARFSCWQFAVESAPRDLAHAPDLSLQSQCLKNGIGHLCWLWGRVRKHFQGAILGAVTTQFVPYCLSDGCLHIILFLYFRLKQITSIWFDTYCSKSGFLLTVVCYWSQQYHN